jgi:hypothetical protein
MKYCHTKIQDKIDNVCYYIENVFNEKMYLKISRMPNSEMCMEHPVYEHCMNIWNNVCDMVDGLNRNMCQFHDIMVMMYRILDPSNDFHLWKKIRKNGPIIDIIFKYMFKNNIFYDTFFQYLFSFGKDIYDKTILNDNIICDCPS